VRFCLRCRPSRACRCRGAVESPEWIPHWADERRDARNLSWMPRKEPRNWL